MKIAICLHLYYVEMFEEICGYLDNFKEIKYDLFVTLPRENKVFLPVIKQKYPSVKILVTPNIGFDIYPFLYFLKEVDLDIYDIIFKLHTKKDIPIGYTLNGVDLGQTRWRNFMFNALMGNHWRVCEIIRTFERHPHAGMISAQEVLLQGEELLARDIDCEKVTQAMLECKLVPQRWEFVAGSVFAARSRLFKPLKRRGFSAEEFPPYFPRDWNGLPYCLERVFGCMVSAQGATIVGLPAINKKI